MENTFVCTKCQKSFDSTGFYYVNGRRLPWCKECRKEAGRTRAVSVLVEEKSKKGNCEVCGLHTDVKETGVACVNMVHELELCERCRQVAMQISMECIRERMTRLIKTDFNELYARQIAELAAKQAAESAGAK